MSTERSGTLEKIEHVHREIRHAGDDGACPQRDSRHAGDDGACPQIVGMLETMEHVRR